MSTVESIQIYMTLSVVIICIQAVVSLRRDPIFYILCFYFLFAFGPVINYLLGAPIYFGTVQSNIPSACLIMLLGIASFSTPHLLFRNKKLVIESGHERHRWFALYPIYILSVFYGIAKLALMLPYRIAGANKVELINLALPSIHYVYLLLQLYFTSFYLNIGEDKKLKKMYYLNLLVYILYCLVIGERDFIFPVFSLFILKIILGKKKEFLIYGFSTLLLIAGATAIFFLRDSTQESVSAVAGILNQGSILFINSYVLKIIDDGHSFFYGWTYLNSLINLIPSWIYKTDFNTLTWFKDLYAKASTSGYGFALDAEAYINFGYYGVVAFFTGFSLYWKLLLKKFNNSEFFRYLTFFSISFSMYSLRNDSLALFKGTFYAMIIYFFVNTLSYLLELKRK